MWLLLASAVTGVPGGALAASAEAVNLVSSALPAEVASLGASEAWWAAVQANIRQDMARPQEAAGIDGLGTEPDWDVAGEGDDEMFGLSVASAGDVDGDGFGDVIVGAPDYLGGGEQGKAYLFLGSPGGLETSWDWSETGEAAGDGFGYSVAGAGDVNGDGYGDIVVGAKWHGVAGRAYLFLGSPSGVSSSPPLILDGENSGDSFGHAVAGAGDVNADGYADIIVGAPDYDDAPNAAVGRAYVYFGSASPDATADNYLTGENQQDWFGRAVGGAGDVDGDGYADVIVGAPGFDNGAYTQAGAAYLFRGDTVGVGRLRPWRVTGQTRDDLFGRAVAGAGDVNGDGYADVVVGAPYYRDEMIPVPVGGAAYVYLGSPTDLTLDWQDFGENVDDRFGVSVAGAGDVNGDGYADIIVGADGYGTAGRAYVYRGGADGLAVQPTWTEDGDHSGEDYGAAVAGAGDVNGDGYADVVVGAPAYSSDRGAAYAYHGSADLPGHDDQWGEVGVSNGDWFGFSLAGAGDVNGDGYSDVIVGAQQYSSSRGRVYVYFSDKDGLPAFSDWHADGESVDDWFGGSVAAAGDVNGDGYADVLVGARGYDDGSHGGAGKAYLYYGGPTTLSGDPWEAVGEASNSEFGSHVAGAGDVNGDGYADILISAPGYDGLRGKVYVYHGSPGGPSATAARTYEGATSWEQFGSAVAGVGDTNGDGYGDIVVGAYGYPSPGGSPAWRGKAQLYIGTDSGLGPISIWTATGENDGDRFGQAVAGAGDVNGDGCGDILIGAPSFGGLRGKVYLYQGGCGGAIGAAVWSGLGNQALDAFGSAVSGAGDVNGDGYADILVGAPQSPANASRGSAYLYTGPLSGISYSADWEVLGQNNNNRFGVSVAGAGDVDGDGYADLLVGANWFDSQRGKAYAYFGNDGGGRRVLARQRRLDRTEVQPWGLTDAPDEFEAALWASDPSGRGRLRLEVEACAPGIPFGDPACLTMRGASWDDLFPPGGYATQRLMRLMVSGLEEDTLYRWRARLLYAPLTVVRTYITPPPNPAHGPWRRFQAQTFEADARTMAGVRVFLPLVQRE